MAGFAVLGRWLHGQVFISLLVVHLECRRRGVATALVSGAERVCSTEKPSTSTSGSNAAMRALCEKLGFVESGYIENLDEASPEILYFKRMNPEYQGPEGTSACGSG